MIELLNRTCDIWKVQRADPEDENSEDVPVLAFGGVPCRKDTIMNRRSTGAEIPVSGGTQTNARATFFIVDPRLSYPTNFDEQMWIMDGPLRWNIQAIHEAEDMVGLHHYEVDTMAGVLR
jgi:hypothetical protein